MDTKKVDHKSLTFFKDSDYSIDPPPKIIEKLLHQADIKINGPHPWDPQVIDAEVYEKIYSRGSLGMGEAYIEGMWDCKDLPEFFNRILRARLDENPPGLAKFFLLLHNLRSKIFNLQSSKRAFQIAEHHYDIGNDLYAAMLDSHWCYSCGFWKDAKDLESAQEAKLDLICRKLDLKPGMKVLEIGCGWGSLAAYMAKYYGVHVTGITVSKEQVEMAKQRCEGLAVDIQLLDYREVDKKVDGKFDRVVSVGMFEHVGHKNYKDFFTHSLNCLTPDGLFLLHTIGTENKKVTIDPWIDRYIFPNGELPAIHTLSNAISDYFIIEDLHNFGPDYDRTLMAWWDNFKSAWPILKDNSNKYDQRFYRIWRYYLMSCAGFFRSKKGQLWQFVLSPKNSTRTYTSVR
jgi:cyclopropane-fatty-acyl-phospholipid synthase